MKNIILLFTACIITLGAKAQKEDSIYFKHEKQIIELQNDINELQKNYEQSIKNIQSDLLNFNNQFRRGTNIMFIGFATTIAAILTATYNPASVKLITGLTIGGAALTIGGGVIQIDSFKHLGGSHSLIIRMKFDL